MKNYKNILLSVGLSCSIANASVVIKLASYGDKGNSDRQVLHIQKTLGLTPSVIQEGGIYRLYSKSFEHRNQAFSLLSRYQELFPDAYIMQSSNRYQAMDKKKLEKTHIPTEMVKLEIPKSQRSVHQSPPQNIISIDDIIIPKNTEEIMTPISKGNRRLSLNTIIKGRTFYICPNVVKSNKGKILIEVSFDSKHTVTYRTILGKIPSLRMHYIVRKKKLYLSRSYTFNPAQYHRIKDTLFDYHLMAKYSQKKSMGTMRYYTNYENAKSYLDSLRF